MSIEVFPGGRERNYDIKSIASQRFVFLHLPHTFFLLLLSPPPFDLPINENPNSTDAMIPRTHAQRERKYMK